jgi:hypothetical protein
MSRILVTASLIAAVLISGCATAPMGPTALVMPAQGKPFEVFAREQAMCKQFAGGEVDGDATMMNMKQFGSAAISTALGAGLGAAVRGRRGAEAGGAMGAMVGAASASNGSARDQNNLQGRYNLAYTQCMYSRGNQIAGAPHAAPRAAKGEQGGYPQSAVASGYPMPGAPDPAQAYPTGTMIHTYGSGQIR